MQHASRGAVVAVAVRANPRRGSEPGRRMGVDMRVEESTGIDRPAEEVPEYVSEVDNFPEWTGTAIEVHKRAPGPVREGDTFTAVVKFLGRRFETPYERASYEANGRFTERAAGGPIPDQHWTYTFQEMSGGTRLTRAVEGEPRDLFKLADPLIDRALKRQVRADLGR
jgi:ligand-binding SRPBCC domain-containing protein